MDARNRVLVKVAWTAAVLVIGLLGGCQPQEAVTPIDVSDEPAATATPETVASPAPTVEVMVTDETDELPVERERPRCAELDIDPEMFPTTEYYVDCLVILTGPEDEVSGLVDVLLGELGIALQQLEGREFELQMSQDEEALSDDLGAPVQGMLARADGRPVVSRLYQLESSSQLAEDEEPVLGVIQAIQETKEQYADEFANVFADPNYLTGSLTDSPCGNPFGAHGSPFGAHGSPFGAHGSPSGGMGLGANPDNYWTQPALVQMDIVNDGDRVVEATGEGVLVGVFDTSPFPGGGWPQAQTVASITHVSPPLELTVLAPPQLTQLSPASPFWLPNAFVREHGLFVAGLIHAVAPQATIQLVRVLDDNGCGDLFTLAEALNRFVQNNASDSPVVVNLSLGVSYPNEPATVGMPTEIVLLEAAVLSAHQAGMVIVAAAGNDSVASQPPLPMNLPAAYEEVIGVAAINEAGARSCFSNGGDVEAPGGDGVEAVDSAGRLYCRAEAANCAPFVPSDSSTFECSWGLTSLVSPLLIGVYPASTGYAYWAGTSFATPLVSGQAALLAAVASRDEVRDAILNAASGGVVEIPASLASVP